MSDKKYIRMDFKHCLGHAVEECGEFLHAAGKLMRWGKHSFNPEPGTSRETNIAWLKRERRDLLEALIRLGEIIDD